MKKHLIPMTDFVLEHPASTDYEWQLSNHLRYAKFLKQPLELCMFVPCDDDGNVLEEPIDIYYKPDFGCQKFPQECYVHDLDKYQQAKKKVLFKGFEFTGESKYSVLLLADKHILFHFFKNTNDTIESLVDNAIELTETAIKQIYIC